MCPLLFGTAALGPEFPVDECSQQLIPCVHELGKSSHRANSPSWQLHKPVSGSMIPCNSKTQCIMPPLLVHGFLP